MTPAQVALVQKTFRQAADLGADTVAELFYAELFEIDPGLKRLFKSSMKDQGRKLMGTLSFVIGSLNDLNKVVGPAQDLAVKHLDYGVEARHYVYVGNALLRTLKKGIGGDFTPEVREAWIAAYKTLADVMREAAYGSKNAGKAA